jgi:ATP-dependent DNA helicase PIF1
MRTLHGYDQVFVTASTGIAACNIGGCTVHSFAGFGLGDKPPDDLVAIVKNSKNSKRRWKYCKVLIIDEISMLSGISFLTTPTLEGELFDKLEYIARKIRKNEDPFGGIQVLVSFY